MTSLRGMDVPLSRVVYRFSGLELDAVAYELTRDGARIRLARQPMDLLLLLLERRRELVSRDEIAGSCGRADVFVDVDAGIQTAMLKIRQVLGDRAGRRRVRRDRAGEGVSILAPVQGRGADDFGQRRGSMTSTPVTHRHNLPADLTSFVGRRKDWAALRR